MSELENINPVAFYRADFNGDMVFRKNNTVDVRKNEGDFTTGWIKPLYDEIPEQPQLTIPKSIAEQADKYLRMDWEFWDINLDIGKYTDEFYEFINCEDNDQENSKLIIAYLAGKALGVELVKVVEG